MKAPKSINYIKTWLNRWKNAISKAQIKDVTEAFNSACWANDLIAILNAIILYWITSY
jgi:hypothetical protein